MAIGTDAGVDATTPGPTSGMGAGGSPPEPMMADAGPDADPGDECHPNPDSLNACTEICPEICNGRDDDCDIEVDEAGAEDACDLAHASADCVDETCVVEDCEAHFRDCDEEPENGCEAGEDDIRNCGSCGHECEAENVIMACMSGECVMVGCSAGYDSCDDDVTTCETPTTTLTDCGGCETACGPLDNALATCAPGECAVGTCAGNFGDCDEEPENGCETELVTLQHCGGCDVPCSFSSAQGDCSTGVCVATSCLPTFDECDGNEANGCESLRSTLYCGACGSTCGVSAGQHANSASCATGSCVVTCAGGYGNCDTNPSNGCEAALDTVEHCGSCAACPDRPHAAESCDPVARTCVSSCDPGYADCNAAPGCETSTRTLTDCGGCGVPCDEASCASGICTTIDCASMPGTADCDADGTSCETDVTTLAHCGSCSNACAFDGSGTYNATLVCTAQGCAADCDADYDDCDGNYRNGCEASLVSPANCGACGDGCAITNATASCSTGECLRVSCNVDYADCDDDERSCETSLAITGSCGSCTNACSFPNAIAACGGTPGARSCELASCADADHADCDLQAANGCERDVRPVGNGGQGPCLPEANCTKSSSGGRDYYVCPTARTWSEARARCQTQLRGDLAQIADSTENAYVAGRLAAASWIGATDGAIEGLWRWGHGNRPFWRGTSSGMALYGAYATWAAGEPNADGDCAQLNSNGGWADADCQVTKPYVCEVMPDLCASDATKYDPGLCGCGVADTDADADGIAACQDGCDGDANKLAPGACGCGTADTNTDGDAQADCNEMCDADPNKLVPGACGCGTPDTNTDGDSQADCNETCDTDANKLAPGACGCGTADTNTDGDSQPNCNETCDSDPAKLAPGVCGCGVADTNTDGDGQADCNETCDADPNKLAPGLCGCGTADTNSDGDALPNCTDGCPNDAAKTAPLACGCGNPETCPAALQWGDARNWNPAMVDFASAPAVTINCTTATINTTDPDGAGSAVVSYTGWCAGQTQPTATVQTQSNGTQIVIVALTGLTVTSGNTLRLIGNRPVILAVGGNATIDGTIDAGARGATPGAGGNVSSACGAPVDDVAAGGSGGLGRGNMSNDLGSAAGGGGAHAAVGQPGGDGADGNQRHGLGGAVGGVATLSPLRGGCPGGAGGTSTVDNGWGGGGAGGAGGGAIQLTVEGTLTVSVSGRIHAGGGGGGVGDLDEEGGGGGGSGGGVLLEAGTLSINGSAIVKANGGGGGSGRGSNGNFTGAVGGDGGATTGATAGGTGMRGAGSGGNGGVSAGGAATAGATGSNYSCGFGCSEQGPGGGGGGGGAGYVVTRTLVVP